MRPNTADWHETPDSETAGPVREEPAVPFHPKADLKIQRNRSIRSPSYIFRYTTPVRRFPASIIMPRPM